MDARTIAWVSYLTFIGWIIAFVSYNNSILKSPLALFHLRQSFGVVIFSWLIIMAAGWLSLGSLGGFYSVYWILRVLLFIMWLLGFISALQGEEKPIPGVGVLFQRWFTFIK